MTVDTQVFYLPDNRTRKNKVMIPLLNYSKQNKGLTYKMIPFLKCISSLSRGAVIHHDDRFGHSDKIGIDSKIPTCLLLYLN